MDGKWKYYMRYFAVSGCQIWDPEEVWKKWKTSGPVQGRKSSVRARLQTDMFDTQAWTSTVNLMDSVQVGKAVFVKANYTTLGIEPKTFSYPGSFGNRTSVCWVEKESSTQCGQKEICDESWCCKALLLSMNFELIEFWNQVNMMLSIKLFYNYFIKLFYQAWRKLQLLYMFLCWSFFKCGSFTASPTKYSL